MSRRLVALATALLAICGAIGGCSGKPAPDTVEMTSAPTGLWIAEQNSETTLDIQAGGFFKITRGNVEVIGEWESAGDNALKVTLQGQTYDMAFTRQDLNLETTLPGESQPTRFTQM